jgi:uracil-DNA glycosylase
VDLFDPDPSKFSPKFVGAKGCEHPYLYIIAEAPGFTEDQQGIPLVGRAGQMLDRALEVSGIDTSKIRFHNVVPYRPIETVSWKTSNRTPKDDEIRFYRIFVQKDVRKTHPKVLLLCGKSAMTGFDVEDIPSEGRTKIFEWEGIPVVTTFHPSYVLRRGERSQDFTNLVSDLKRAWKIAEGELIDKAPFEVVDILRGEVSSDG